MNAVAALKGHDLGSRVVAYGESDAILYALCVGAGPDRLPLVYERDLHVLPTFGLGLGLWAVEEAGGLGAYDRLKSLHAAQQLTVHAPLPRSGKLEMRAHVANVWDKGSAATVDIAVECEQFTAVYAIHLPGSGGWGGERAPSTPRVDLESASFREEFHIPANLPALYRLTGDLHPVHIDPEVSSGYGFERPTLHGLCTLGIAARTVAEAAGAQPWELRELRARFAAPVLPDNTLEVRAQASDGEVDFDARIGATGVLSGGHARF
ncbi:MaoC/PaaZ C-terminal domain-containing protein [Rhodococcus sp. Z13]|uniref:MaoC/PaaZ C-terminal domain-containing protein n=1 Tax=Rhodococcus sacchari TaxID=2962047 RepID=A0ACD4DK95_9NOCA|nr:MaoC/PaaZ C-terminal domain-containing protein [Rhodococcus sp. Z13]UYP20462.1 MaoC/PaaZ C-terminal domain-containing protein [Rhodococcus sp. Z13]